MAKDKIDELEKKKQQLQNELHELQGELDNSLDQMRDDVSNNLNPKSIIRKYPLSIVGASALLGYLLGHKGKSNSKPSSNEDATGTTGEFRGTLFSELKRLATRKAVTFASNYVEKLLEKKAEDHLSSTSDEKD